MNNAGAGTGVDSFPITKSGFASKSPYDTSSNAKDHFCKDQETTKEFRVRFGVQNLTYVQSFLSTSKDMRLKIP